jgi:amino-acid N-acetyltransferase
MSVSAVPQATSITVTTATPADAPSIANLLRRSAPETIPVAEANVRRRWFDFLVIRVPVAGIVATAALHPVDDDVLELRSLAVEATWRGQHLGAHLVGHAVRLARDSARRLVCVTLSPNFFARQGFRRVPLRSTPEKRGRPDMILGRRRVAMSWTPLNAHASGKEPR